MKIASTPLTVAQLLGAQNEQYVIPAYQRRYSWRQQQVEDLWDDLEALTDADSHLLGTIVCLTAHHAVGINGLELVDGQQRLTTIGILLHSVLERLKQEGEKEEAQELSRLLGAKALGKEVQPKILLESLDAKQFQRHAGGDLAPKAGDNERLRQAFAFFDGRLQKLPLSEVGVLLYRLRNQAQVIRLDVSEARDAFKLFETINNRGLRLSSTDIIKNFILGNAARFGPKSLELARERWRDVLSALDGLAIDGFFRQYAMANIGKRVTKSEVVDEFQRAFMREVVEAASLPERHRYSGQTDAEDDEDDALNGDDAANEEDDSDEDESSADSGPVQRVSFAAFLDRLVSAARIYRQLIKAKTGVQKLDRRLRNLWLIRAQPSYTCLMALRLGGCPDKTFDEVLRLTEAFFFRRHVTRARTNDNEAVCARLSTVDPLDPLPAIRESFREHYPSDEKFRQEFIEAVYPSRVMDRARYCFEQLELAEQGSHPELLPAGADLVHIEHIIPQKIKTKTAKKKLGDWVEYLGKTSLADHPKYVARIGNLTLFSGELNIGASNNPYHRKKTAHAKSAFRLTNELPTKYREFRFKQVEERSKYLADLALKVWPAI